MKAIIKIFKAYLEEREKQKNLDKELQSLIDPDFLKGVDNDKDV